MELSSERSGDGGSGLKEEKRSEHSVGDDDGLHKQEIVVEELPPVANTEKSSILETEPSASSSKKEKVDDELETTKAEMGVVIEENERLKVRLNKIMSEYRTLEMQFQDMLKQGTTKKGEKGNEEKLLEESDLVSLSLGRVGSTNINNQKSDEKIIKVSKASKDDEGELTLGLECKFETSKSGSPENSCEVAKEEGGGTQIKRTRDTEDEVAEQNPAKKPRVSVRARCDTPTMNDGCQWRKYGQKIAKGNPCPRAYYRCTIAPSCPVRKQVQRCAEDLSILITTYEGTHNHSLPPSAIAMASRTSAAASMLLSGSSSSTSATANSLNFYLSKPRQQLYLSNPALSSSSPSHPTITLDLTSHAPSSSSSSPFVRFTSGYNNQPRYPSSSSLSFNNRNLNMNMNMNMNTNILSSVNFGRQQVENIYQSYMQKTNSNTALSQPVSVPADPISAATKVITTDPTFQSALAAALTSFIGNQGVNSSVGESNLTQKTKWEEVFPPSNSSKLNALAPSMPNSSSKTKSFMFLPPSSLPFATPKSASASPAHNSDATN
ncbi:hypothetical protein Fmac_026335 [Flemingia macrophylla]|uniref:WRKY domain-containing protein n=1 Tax=Flemingia macrophylla TaxID=520843 RepID=A0ABD1LEJ7_9FABA